MSFERLIVCVDASYSMDNYSIDLDSIDLASIDLGSFDLDSMRSDSKLTNAKKLLLEVVSAFGCDTKYFKFTHAPQELSSDEFSNLSADGGTDIEDTIKQLFSNHFRKWAHDGKNTKFIFVTDADDSIEDVASCISAKGSCISAYDNKLDCECVLTGSEGGCESELKQIFGSNAFHHCSDENFQSVLTAICGGIKQANTIAQTKLPNLQQEIDNFANSEQQDQQQLSQEMQEIVDKLKDVKNKNDQAKQQLDAAKREMSTLNSSTPTIIADADGARTPDQMTAAEEAIESQTTAYQTQYSNANRAGEFLDQAQKALETEGKKADKMAENLSKKVDDVSKQASSIMSNIITTIKELTSITTGAYQQVKHLKGEFNKQLSDLLAVVSKNENLTKEFERVKNGIKQSFKDMRSRGKELSDFKKEIANHITQLNTALERLDDRW